MTRQHAMIILKRAGVWKPHEKGNRTEFLGITVTKDTKDALKREAVKQGTSQSQLTSQILTERLEQLTHSEEHADDTDQRPS